MDLRRACVSAALLFLACGGERAPEPEQPITATPPQDSPQAAPASAASARPGPARVRYDLARHVARAELRQGDARVIDLGAPSGHQHTLGGWRTRSGDVHDFAGPRAAVVRDVPGFFLLPIERADRCALALRGRSFSDRHLTIYVDDETVGPAELPTDGSFAVARATIPQARCTPGDHELRVRVGSTGSAPGIARAGVAIDWIRLGPADDGDDAPPSPASLARQNGAHVELAIPDGWSLAYALEVPSGARLRGTARGTGRLHVVAERDGAPARELAVTSASAEGARVDLDLASFAPHVTRITLRAEGEVALVDPAVVTLDAQEPRALPRVRNVVVYLTDTLRADHLRAYRPDSRVETPGLGQFVSHAATFLSGHSQENWTKPSVATLLSGLFPWEHHATTEDGQVPGSVELVSERLRGAGFHTGAFVANGFVSDRFGFEQGWSTFRNYVRE